MAAAGDRRRRSAAARDWPVPLCDRSFPTRRSRRDRAARAWAVRARRLDFGQNPRTMRRSDRSPSTVHLALLVAGVAAAAGCVDNSPAPTASPSAPTANLPAAPAPVSTAEHGGRQIVLCGGSLQPAAVRRGDDRARAPAVLRSAALGLGEDVLRHLPRSPLRLRPAERALHAARRPRYARASVFAPRRRCATCRRCRRSPSTTSTRPVDESVDQGPTGGHTWDGRADTTHDQARLPLTSPFEMANPDIDSVVDQARSRSARRPISGRVR